MSFLHNLFNIKTYKLSLHILVPVKKAQNEFSDCYCHIYKDTKKHGVRFALNVWILLISHWVFTHKQLNYLATSSGVSSFLTTYSRLFFSFVHFSFTAWFNEILKRVVFSFIPNENGSVIITTFKFVWL